MSAELSLTLFFISTPIFLVILPFWVEKNGQAFNKNPVVHLIIKRACWILACWLMTLCTSIIYSIGQAAGFNMSGPVTLYLTIFGWAGYGLMFFMAWRMLVDAVTLRMIEKDKERFGE